MTNTEQRFWANVEIAEADQCWLWRACRNAKGYGRFWGGASVVLAHRFALLLSGKACPEGALALHSCDTPSCVNPSHLRWGTALENTKEMYDRKRDAVSLGTISPAFGRRNGAYTKPETRAKGEAHGCAKLTVDQVLAIRQQVGRGKDIGAIYGVSSSTVNLIRARRIWAHLP